MPTLEIIKAWKDEEYRDTLTTEQRCQLLEHPAGAIELAEPAERDAFRGDVKTFNNGCCKKTLP